MDSRSFKCEACGETFEKTRSDDEAQAEYESLFGADAVSDKVVVCDDCYRVLIPGGKPIPDLLEPAEGHEPSGTA